MRIDIIHLTWPDTSMPQRHLHRPQRATPVRQRRGQMMRIRAHAVPHDLGVDLYPPLPRVLQFLQNHDARAFADDEPCAVCVEGAGGRLRVGVVGGGEAAGASEAADREGVDAGFRAAGEHDGGVAVHDEAAGVADGVRAGGAGGCDGVVGSLEECTLV
jgi:hypothetical protein